MQQPGGALLMQRRGFGQAAIDRGRLGFLLDPFVHAPPAANETFMRDIDDRIRVERYRPCRHQERTSGGAEFLDDAR